MNRSIVIAAVLLSAAPVWAQEKGNSAYFSDHWEIMDLTAAQSKELFRSQSKVQDCVITVGGNGSDVVIGGGCDLSYPGAIKASAPAGALIIRSSKP